MSRTIAKSVSLSRSFSYRANNTTRILKSNSEAKLYVTIAVRCLPISVSVNVCGAAWCAAANDANASATSLFLLFRVEVVCRSMCNFVACPLTHTKTRRLVALSLSSVPNSSHTSALPSLHFCVSPRVRLVAMRTTYSLSDLILRFLSCTCIAAMTANSFARLFVYSRPGKVKEQFLSSLMSKNTPQSDLLNLASWLQTHVPSVQTTTLSLFLVSLSNLSSERTLSCKKLQLNGCARVLGPMSVQTTDSGSSRKIPHLEVHGGHVKQSRLLGACFSRRSVSHRGHLQRMCSSSSGSSPQKRHKGDSALWQSNGLFSVQTQPQRSSRRSLRCSGGILKPVIALTATSLSISVVDVSHVATSVTCFSPIDKTKSSSDFMESSAFRSIQ